MDIQAKEYFTKAKIVKLADGRELILIPTENYLWKVVPVLGNFTITEYETFKENLKFDLFERIFDHSLRELFVGASQLYLDKIKQQKNNNHTS